MSDAVKDDRAGTRSSRSLPSRPCSSRPTSAPTRRSATSASTRSASSRRSSPSRRPSTSRCPSTPTSPGVRVRHQHRRHHGPGRREPDRGPEVACGPGSSSPARAPSTPSAGPPTRPWPRCARAAPASATSTSRTSSGSSIADRRPDPRLPPRGALRPPGADPLRPLHPVRAPRRPRGDGAVGPRDHARRWPSAPAWCSAPRAAACRPRTRTTGSSTRRARTGCIPSWCRG